LDPIDEEIYKEFSTTLMMDNWIPKRIAGIILIAVLQILLALTIQFSQNEFYMIPVVYLPLVTISLTVYYSPRKFMNEHIQKFACLYVIIYGPVFFCARAWIVGQEFIAYLIAAMYMSVIYGSNFALGLRFIYTVVVAVVAIVAWFFLASFAWFNRKVFYSSFRNMIKYQSRVRISSGPG
jgi:hypothetical protein